MNSKFGNINLKDLGKGFVVAVFTAVIFGVNESLQSGVLPDLAKMKSIGIIALSAGLAYLAKNLFSNKEGEVFASDKGK